MLLRSIVIAAMVATAAASAIRKPHIATPAALTKPSISKALELRGGGMIESTTYVKASAIIYAVYALQFVGIPKKFITDHFASPAPDALHVFLARGAGVAIAFTAYAMYKFDVPVQLIVAYNILVGLVYPWNAAFISKLDVKYPMHRVPEILMAALAVAGLLAL